MTKIKWDRSPVKSVLNSEYYLNPKEGFDKGWHHNWSMKLQGKQNRLEKEIDLGEHQNHIWTPIKTESGPHYGKLICITCNNKFIRWLPKDFF